MPPKAHLDISSRTALDAGVRLVCTNARVLRLLAITGLAKALPVHASSDEALAEHTDARQPGEIPAAATIG